MTVRICKIDGCKNPHGAGGYCNLHYHRMKKLGKIPKLGTNKNEPMDWIVAHASYSSDECLTWPFTKNDKGYGIILIDGVRKRAHRIMCEQAHGAPLSNDDVARHLCGKGSIGCINPKHLKWGTQANNEQDKILHGTSNQGYRHGMAKLDEEKVRHIRGLKGQMKNREIASMFGISPANVSMIHSRKTWSHIS